MELLANMKDTTLCAKEPLKLQASVSNANTWQWQQSNDGTSYTNLSGATGNPYNTTVNNTQWYRLLANNTLCSYSDTFNGFKVTANPLPQPNLGSDATLANGGSKVLSPGTFSNYNWSKGNNTPTLTVDKNNLDTGKNTIWVEVTDNKGCKGRDTVIITLEPMNGVSSPVTDAVKVYPVPFSNVLNIETGSAGVVTWLLYSANGSLIQYGKGSGSFVIPALNLPNGNYSLQLYGTGLNRTLTVMKQ